MKAEIAANSVEIDDEMSHAFASIIDQGHESMTSFMKLFWKEQRKMFCYSMRGQRYHPMIVRFCLSLHSKSPSAYKEFRDALGRKQGGVLTLPCKELLETIKTGLGQNVALMKMSS